MKFTGYNTHELTSIARMLATGASVEDVAIWLQSPPEAVLTNLAIMGFQLIPVIRLVKVDPVTDFAEIKP